MIDVAEGYKEENDLETLRKWREVYYQQLIMSIGTITGNVVNIDGSAISWLLTGLPLRAKKQHYSNGTFSTN